MDPHLICKFPNLCPRTDNNPMSDGDEVAPSAHVREARKCKQSADPVGRVMGGSGVQVTVEISLGGWDR